MILGKDNIERLPPPIGTSDWARFSRTSYCVDKTLILKDLIDADSTVVLFTRPRRFGKTTMMRMIAEFYDGDATLFADKQIWAAVRRDLPRRRDRRHREDWPRLLQEQGRDLPVGSVPAIVAENGENPGGLI